MSGFQTVVMAQGAPAVEGDFASANPRSTIPPALGGAWKVAASQSVRVGYFAWGANNGLVYSSLAAATAIGGQVLGFVGRQANEPSDVITTYLAESSMLLNAGMPCTLFSTGDFFVSLIGADPGELVYAVEATGAPSLVDDATTIDSGFVARSQAKVNAVSAATSTIAAQTGILTIATLSSGTFEAGMRLTGGTVPTNTFITAQLSGTTGGAGTYQTTNVGRAAVAAFTATGAQGTLAKIGKGT
jgi:hypothetical protein